MHGVGSWLANSCTHAPMLMAHLYNFCHVDAKIKGGSEWKQWTSAGPWEDMNRLVFSPQPHNVFIGGQAPTTGSECWKNLALVNGIPMNQLNTALGSRFGKGATRMETILVSTFLTLRPFTYFSRVGENASQAG